MNMKNKFLFRLALQASFCFDDKMVKEMVLDYDDLIEVKVTEGSCMSDVLGKMQTSKIVKEYVENNEGKCHGIWAVFYNVLWREILLYLLFIFLNINICSRVPEGIFYYLVALMNIVFFCLISILNTHKSNNEKVVNFGYGGEGKGIISLITLVACGICCRPGADIVYIGYNLNRIATVMVGVLVMEGIFLLLLNICNVTLTLYQNQINFGMITCMLLMSNLLQIRYTTWENMVVLMGVTFLLSILLTVMCGMVIRKYYRKKGIWTHN